MGGGKRKGGSGRKKAVAKSATRTVKSKRNSVMTGSAIAAAAAVCAAAMFWGFGEADPIGDVCDSDNITSSLGPWGGAEAADVRNFFPETMCEFESVRAQDVDDWDALFEKYLGDETRMSVQPLLIEGDMEDWTARALWTKENFLGKWKHKRSPVMTEYFTAHLPSGFASDSGLTPKRKLGEVVAGFDAESEVSIFSFLGQLGTPFRNHVHYPSILSKTGASKSGDWGYNWSIMAHKGGLGFHRHPATIFAMVNGHKAWWVYPNRKMPEELRSVVLPNLALASNWMDQIDDLPEAIRPLRCMQRPGQMLLVPSWMWHATYNVGHAIGVGFQRGPSMLYNTELWGKVERGPSAQREEAVATMNALYNEDPYYLTNIAMKMELLISGLIQSSKNPVREMIKMTKEVCDIAAERSRSGNLAPLWASLHIRRTAETLQHFSSGDPRARSTVDRYFKLADEILPRSG